METQGAGEGRNRTFKKFETFAAKLVAVPKPELQNKLKEYEIAKRRKRQLRTRPT
jgi:hypothetical protein